MPNHQETRVAKECKNSPIGSAFGVHVSIEESDRRFPGALGGVGSIAVLTRVIEEGVWGGVVCVNVDDFAGVVRGLLQQGHVFIRD